MKLAVFCGSTVGDSPVFVRAAEELAAAMNEYNYDLVFGGTNLGLMNVLADKAVEYDNSVYGVITQQFLDEGVAYEKCQLIIRKTMHSRKKTIFSMSNAMVAMPGGSGTMDEFFEAWTWSQIGIHRKPVGLLNVDGYFDHLHEFFKVSKSRGFLKSEYLDYLFIDHCPLNLLGKIQKFVDDV